MARRTASALATLSAIVTASVMFTAQNANADLVMYCIGSGGPVTVPSDLYVPAGESCSLDRTTITGNVRVAAGANLIVKGGTINGEVRVASDGYLDTTDTRIDGEVNLAAGGFGIYMRNTDTGRVVVAPKGSATIAGFLFVEQGSKVDGNIQAGVGEVHVADTEVTGNISTSAADYTDLHGSFVDGTVSVLNNATGSVVCGSAVQGKATFAGNQGGVQLGPNGGLDSCASGGYFARDVVISNTTGRSSLDDNIVNGKLELTANNPASEVATNNRIRGGIVGDHSTPAAARAAAAAGTRGTGLQRSQARLAAATGEAAVSGKARL
ncbi:hypothetical protein JOF56_007204 [Kibdelosporangium banguiense]|uniref:Right-handed parallel beta-helix repeat-containing protein n=1 Tax=Kibdelosporangium banguiense TaxID=1365924 RepID=A0ABS4TQY1_9PSEU|nr:hypothetical protein [Kibdelosporangium banguiense]MBP2326819.1 hypothetical protein [Kibdelosporangium banguiense]